MALTAVDAFCTVLDAFACGCAPALSPTATVSRGRFEAVATDDDDVDDDDDDDEDGGDDDGDGDFFVYSFNLLARNSFASSPLRSVETSSPLDLSSLFIKGVPRYSPSIKGSSKTKGSTKTLTPPLMHEYPSYGSPGSVSEGGALHRNRSDQWPIARRLACSNVSLHTACNTFVVAVESCIKETAHSFLLAGSLSYTRAIFGASAYRLAGNA